MINYIQQLDYQLEISTASAQPESAITPGNRERII